MFLWIVLTKLYLFHPFHVSICDVTYDSNDKHLKISVRLFADDLEMGLSGYANTPELDLLKLDSTKLNVLIQRYLLENLHFTTNKEILPIHYLGSQKEDNGIWCFLEYENLNPFDEISVFNSLLVNTFRDQENLVHFRKNKTVKSLRLNEKNKVGTVNWYP
jgi:hypothetical protein|tara:strand:- start:830 stop:1312 length:483 start_codon:yes stop_codon:yes gene_type:complete